MNQDDVAVADKLAQDTHRFHQFLTQIRIVKIGNRHSACSDVVCEVRCPQRRPVDFVDLDVVVTLQIHQGRDAPLVLEASIRSFIVEQLTASRSRPPAVANPALFSQPRR